MATAKAHSQQSLLQFFSVKSPISSQKRAAAARDGPDFDMPLAEAMSPSGVSKSHKMQSNFSSVKSPTKDKKSVATQLFIDAGQRDLAMTTCPSCGMSYAKGVETDEQTHKQFCKQHTAQVNLEIIFKGWKQENVVDEIDFFDETRIVMVHPKVDDLSPQQQQKIDEIKAVVDQELGFSASTQDEEIEDYRFYLYVKQDRVVGALIAKTIGYAHRVVSAQDEAPALDAAPGGIPAPSRPLRGLASLSLNKNRAERAVAGISRIWVHPKFRRQGIASKLVDACRSTLVFGYKVPESEVAFSPPTAMGNRFAASYCKSKYYLVYTSL